MLGIETGWRKYHLVWQYYHFFYLLISQAEMRMLPQLPNDFHEFINLNITYTVYYKLAGFIRPLQKQHVWSSTSHNSLYHSTFIPLRWLSVAACVRFKSLMLPYRAATCTATTYFKSIIQVYEPSRSLQFVKAATAKHETSIQTLSMCCPLLVVSPNLIQSQNPFMSSKNHLKCPSESTCMLLTVCTC